MLSLLGCSLADFLRVGLQMVSLSFLQKKKQNKKRKTEQRTCTNHSWELAHLIHQRMGINVDIFGD